MEPVRFRSEVHVSLFDLLSRGYLPKELPRPFTTGAFATLATTTSPLPGSFSSGSRLPTTKGGRYSLARGGLLRRPLSLCNPISQFRLCEELISNWPSLTPFIGGTAFSATAPVFKPAGRAIDGVSSQRDRPTRMQNTRLGNRFVLQTDISRFYGSIYTHSIPWALHTKRAAKANHSTRLLGNKIDHLVRMGQDQQTVGIPIGPDTSLVIAELIMQRCDQELLRRIPNLRGHRFIDDYELGFQTRTEAEDAFHLLESCLSDFELALNPKKTMVVELPLPLEATWAAEGLNMRSTRSGQATDITRYFSRAYSMHSQYPNDAVLQFAIAKFRSVTIDPANWELFQRLLLLCVAPEPASFPYALEQIIIRVNAGATPVIAELESIANGLIISHAKLRHSSEVANALWGCLALSLRVSADAVDCVSSCDDSVVALLALDCEQHGLMSKSLDKTHWASLMTVDSLYDENWLLAYEANVKGWLPSASGTDHVATDPNFGFLKAGGVQFYDSGLGAPAGTGTVPLPTLQVIATAPGSG
jgi:Reverse transcriptase (RNA-dependent DNA polymerase)